MLPPKPLVALLMSFSSGYLREVYRGIFSYLREHGRPYRVTVVDDLSLLRTLNTFPAGVIAQVSHPDIRDRVSALRVPVVNVSGRLAESKLVTVRVDDGAIGKMAAEHLLAGGLKHFAYLGHTDAIIYDRRGEGFSRRLAQSGHACEQILARIRPSTSDMRAVDRRRLCRLLRNLPKPAGILCGTDWMAGLLYAVCEELGIRIGTELAVVGVDNDEFLCETSDPPLSSVDVQPSRVGYEAAGLMAKLLKGRPPPPNPVMVAPFAVMQRQSSDLLAVSDPLVALVLRHIREHVNEPLNVGRLVPLSSLSRRVLERRFRASMGCSILAEIHRTKMERIREMLVHTEQTLDQIAASCGFAQVSHMSALFRKKTGQAPGACRSALRRASVRPDDRR